MGLGFKALSVLYTTDSRKLYREEIHMFNIVIVVV